MVAVVKKLDGFLTAMSVKDCRAGGEPALAYSWIGLSSDFFRPELDGH